MPLDNNSELIETLSQKDIFFKNANIQCWVRKEDKSNIYIFSKYFVKQSDLKSEWENIRDHLAISFQSQTLEKESERWNIYLFFYVAETVDLALKQAIEEDKFSTRKIILDNVQQYSLDFDKEFINKELFDLDIIRRTSIQEPLDTLLIREDSDLFTTLNLSGEKIDDNNLQAWLKQLENEQN